MSKPQQPELHRSSRGATDPASTKTHITAEHATPETPSNQVPPENQPGHHPEHEQDKPDLTADTKIDEQGSLGHA